MKYISEKLERFADLGFEIVEQLEQSDPSMERIQQLIQQRSDLISDLDAILEHLEMESVTQEEEHQVNETFRKIREAQSVMNPALQQLLNRQKVAMNDATQRRKADDRYHLLETPDISYFSDK
ncbi:hypothetical protein QLX67_05780 [Balneolaceae bacterium ANBcel3]|nr:hypothetical protein [Balneolaceae bacterium ANBcel3]